MNLRAHLAVILVLFLSLLSGIGQAQSGTMSTLAGLNTVQYKLNATAAPDVTIAVGLTEYCEHVNSAYQCWYKSGPNANQPVNFLGSTSPKTDSDPWSQNNNNSGNTSHCPSAYSPNAQLLHDNVYNLWIMQKRITASANGHNYMCVAVSNIDDVSQSSFSWFAFEYDLDNVIPTNSHGNFYYPDYPQAGLWQTSTSTTPPYAAATDQALWLTYDLLDPNNANNINGVLLCAVDLAGLRASTSSPWVNNSKTPACVVAHALTTYNQRRSWAPANNSDTTPPISGDGEMFTYMIEPPKDNKSYLTDPNHTQGVEQWTVNWSAAPPTPTFVNSWDLPSTQATGDQLGCFNASSYYNTACIPQPSTSTTAVHIDSVADRIHQHFHYTSSGGHGSIWTSAHDIQIIPSSSVRSQTEADIRVLQRNATSSAIYVAGDYPIQDPNDGSAYVFLPSVVRDKAGNLQGILGISGTGANEHPGLDSLFLNAGTLTSSSYGYIASPVTDGDAEDTDSLNYRWGDWFSAVLDPSDSCTVWVAGEFLQSNRTTEPYWYTEMASLPPASTCLSGPVLLSNVSLSFGSQPVGSETTPIVETITNNQSVNLNITGISITNSAFTETNTCQQPIAPRGSCTISVSFLPQSTSKQTGQLIVTDDASGSSTQTIALSGSGASAAISFSASTLAFGNQGLNTTSAAQTLTVTNSGAGDVAVNSAAVSGGYSMTDNCAGITLTEGQACTITVTFTPTTVGSNSGTITVYDTAAGAPHIVTLTGSGQLVVSFSSNLTFAATNVGSTSAAQTMTLTNNGSQTLTFTYSTSGDYSAVGNGTAPCNGSLAAFAKCTFGVTFSPTFNGQIKGALSIAFNGTTASGGLMGTGQNGAAVPLTFSPSSLSFGNVALNAAPSKIVTVKNAGSTSINLNSVSGSGYYVAVASGTTPCGGTLASGKTCTMTVTFTPLVTGTSIGGITITDSASVSTQVLNATGTGVLPVTMSPSSLSFGTVTVGSTSAAQVVTVTNNQSSATTINSVVTSGDFIYTAGGTSPCGASIAANSSCTLGVEFSPASSGAISGDLTFTYSAASSPQVVNLSGTGQ